MELEHNGNRKKHTEEIIDYINGTLVLYKGWELLEYFRHFPLRIIFLLLVGFSIITGTALQERIEKKVRNFSSFFHIGESMALFTCGTIFLEKGKSRMPAIFFFLGLVTLVIGLTKLLAGKDNRKKALLRLHFAMGVAFIVFAAIMCVVMAKSPFYRHPFMYMTLGSFVVVGIFSMAKARIGLRKMTSKPPAL
jgi:hypothetical protein